MHLHRSHSLLLFISGSVDIVRFLLNAGARMDIANSQGKTLLQVSAFVGQHSCVRLIRNFIPFIDIKYYSVPQGQRGISVFRQEL